MYKKRVIPLLIIIIFMIGLFLYIIEKSNREYALTNRTLNWEFTLEVKPSKGKVPNFIYAGKLKKLTDKEIKYIDYDVKFSNNSIFSGNVKQPNFQPNQTMDLFVTGPSQNIDLKNKDDLYEIFADSVFTITWQDEEGEYKEEIPLIVPGKSELKPVKEESLIVLNKDGTLIAFMITLKNSGKSDVGPFYATINLYNEQLVSSIGQKKITIGKDLYSPDGQGYTIKKGEELSVGITLELKTPVNIDELVTAVEVEVFGQEGQILTFWLENIRVE
ncbi:hypothetical protein L1765_00690 [Microaerobacter geothermalis]|uniref:hypothetical protein n=1 Tax=Microaerobacter geothermalis TaxID=674972 RepID=UPI001F3AC1DE|nr:hypothetical protein [Microaerobacter geothermalis]MCF6092508.1 hypothetical protein [Microaerobacter geothermalis]